VIGARWRSWNLPDRSSLIIGDFLIFDDYLIIDKLVRGTYALALALALACTRARARAFIERVTHREWHAMRDTWAIERRNTITDSMREAFDTDVTRTERRLKCMPNIESCWSTSYGIDISDTSDRYHRRVVLLYRMNRLCLINLLSRRAFGAARQILERDNVETSEIWMEYAAIPYEAPTSKSFA